MDKIYRKFKELNINFESICLTQRDMGEPYFCYPLNVEPIGYEGYIMYCFIEGYGETVFASNPMSCSESYVNPLSYNFIDFLRLILACGSANPIEQISGLGRERFERHLSEELQHQTIEQKQVMEHISEVFSITPMDEPYDYVTELQNDFDFSKIRYAGDSEMLDNRQSTVEFYFDIVQDIIE